MNGGLCPLEVLIPKSGQAGLQRSIGGKSSQSSCCLGGNGAGESIGAPVAGNGMREIGGGSRLKVSGARKRDTGRIYRA
jgi:hypothetical protein